MSDLEFIDANTKSNISQIDSYISEKIGECELTLKALFSHDGKSSGANFKEAAHLILKSPTKSVKAALLIKNDLVKASKAATVL